MRMSYKNILWIMSIPLGDVMMGAICYGLYYPIRYASIIRIPCDPTDRRSVPSERSIMNSAIPGNLHVSNDVLADIVGNAAMECYGVVGMTAPSAVDGIAKILPASRLRRGVVVASTEAGIHVDLYVVIEYGTNIATVSQNLVDQVSFALKEYARVPIEGVEVHVQDVKVRR